MQHIIKDIFSTVQKLYSIEYHPDIIPAPKPELGEYCIGVFSLAKPLGKSPNIIATELSETLKLHTDLYTSVGAIGGYVNFFLTDSAWIDIFHTPKETLHLKNETYVVDYIGMNVGKPPHIGHICTPLIGQSIINTARYLGATVISDSHIGDWGSLFGKLIIGYKKYGNSEKLASDAVDHLLEIYIKISSDIERDPEIEQACRDAFKKLSEGYTEYVELWQSFTQMTIETMKRILSAMHISEDYDIGESFYEGLGLPAIGNPPPLRYDMNSIVEELLDLAIATKNEDTSVGVHFPEETKMPSTIIRKKDQTNLYLTSELSAIKYRTTNGWNPTKILYCTDVRQSLHFKQAFWISKTAWKDTETIDLVHVSNGALMLPEGAMSTRKGNIIRLESLLEEGITRTRTLLEEKGRSLSETDIREITIGAIKYSYLMQDRERDIIFTWEKALNFEGHSGPYIQYAYVRAKKLLLSGTNNTNTQDKIPTLSPTDKSLIQVLKLFEGVVKQSALTYKPHHIANYAYQLAVAFNSFYVHTPKIIDETDEVLRSFRIMLIQNTCETLKTAFQLLAIEMPEEM